MLLNIKYISCFSKCVLESVVSQGIILEIKLKMCTTAHVLLHVIFLLLRFYLELDHVEKF
jgi:hypothetical protein